jgi:predicted ATPase/DNA-binding CsgD family transcriptional regulator
MTEPLFEPLTRRERDILALLAQGHNGPEIAEKLTLAVSSVKWHTQHLYAKLGVNSKKQAVARARELGLLGSLPAASAPGLPVTPSGMPGSASVQTAPSPAAQPERKHNLPLQVTRFFGREREVAQLIERLVENRLVTLTGSGGVGKTRLSLRTAEEVLGDFAGGVWLVELAPLSDPALVAQQVASSLGLRDESRRPTLETLTFFLRDRHLLLVLDNCEHLLEACGRLADTLLRACPGLRILASSREPLGIAGEAVFSVPSLSFPDPDHLPPIDRLTDYMAVSLFIDRARLVLPDYQVTASNAISLARICQRLDGIPLALEMAAARLNIFTAEHLADRLDDVFHLLTGGSRSALPRQQTLRATVDWSYKLLSEPERLLFQRLSVFAGGCTLEAAEAVCADPARGGGLEVRQAILAQLPAALPGLLLGAEILEVLASLVAKSMVIANRRPGVDARYHLLEFTRQYAREKLQDAGDSERLHNRHRDFFLEYAESNFPEYGFRKRLTWIRKLEAERENLRRALEWSFSDLTNVEAAPRLVSAMPYLWTSYHEYVNWLTKGVAWCQSHAEISDRIYAYLLGMASNPLAQDDPQTALTWVQQAIDLSRRLGPDGRETLMWNLIVLANQHLRSYVDVAPAQAPFAEAEAIFLALGPDRSAPEKYPWTKAAFAAFKADLANGQGHYLDAKMQASESVRLYEQIGDPWNRVRPQTALGNACLNLGEYEQAREHFLEALSLNVESGGPQQEKAEVIRCQGIVEFRQGSLDRALGHCQESLREAAGFPEYNIIASCLGLCAGIAAKQGQPSRAATLSGASAALWKKQGRKPREDSSLDTLLQGWRDGPDEPAISQAFKAGQALNVDQATAYALSDDVSWNKPDQPGVVTGTRDV